MRQHLLGGLILGSLGCGSKTVLRVLDLTTAESQETQGDQSGGAASQDTKGAENTAKTSSDPAGGKEVAGEPGGNAAPAGDPPAIEKTEPTVSWGSGGGTLVVTGKNFAPGAAVLVGERLCMNPSLSSLEIRCTIPPHAPGMADITVKNKDGQKVVAAKALRFFTAVFSSSSGYQTLGNSLSGAPSDRRTVVYSQLNENGSLKVIGALNGNDPYGQMNVIGGMLVINNPADRVAVYAFQSDNAKSTLVEGSPFLLPVDRLPATAYGYKNSFHMLVH